jgi:hypothetical protein
MPKVSLGSSLTSSERPASPAPVVQSSVSVAPTQPTVPPPPKDPKVAEALKAIDNANSGAEVADITPGLRWYLRSAEAAYKSLSKKHRLPKNEISRRALETLTAFSERLRTTAPEGVGPASYKWYLDLAIEVFETLTPFVGETNTVGVSDLVHDLLDAFEVSAANGMQSALDPADKKRWGALWRETVVAFSEYTLPNAPANDPARR